MDKLLSFFHSPLGKRILLSIVIFLIGLRFDIFLVLIPLVFIPWRRKK